jgi:hypothetical protein
MGLDRAIQLFANPICSVRSIDGGSYSAPDHIALDGKSASYQSVAQSVYQTRHVKRDLADAAANHKSASDCS